MNTYYLKKFRRLAEEKVYAQLAEEEGFAEIIKKDKYEHFLWWTYGCCPEDKCLDGIGHFAGYKIFDVDNYLLSDDKRRKELCDNLKEARRNYILSEVAHERFLRQKKDHERHLLAINARKRIEL